MDDITYYDYGDTSSLFAVFAGFFLIFGIIALVGYVFTSIATMLLFKKAGHPRAWGAWVPFYNTYLFFKFGGQSPLWFWIYLASIFINVIPFIGPFASFVGSVMSTIAIVYAVIFINNSFGKQDSIVLWTIFGFLLTPIWALVLALGSDQYFRANSPLFLNNSGVPADAW